MEIQGNLLTTNQGTYRIIHHICPQTSQHSIVAFTEEYATFALEALNAGQSLKDEFKFKPLSGFDEYRPYFACLGAYKGDKLVGFWDIPTISTHNNLITANQFTDSAYTQLCNLALAEGAILSHRQKNAALDERPSTDFQEVISADEDLSNAFELAPTLILNAPLPARKLGKLKPGALNMAKGVESLQPAGDPTEAQPTTAEKQPPASEKQPPAPAAQEAPKGGLGLTFKSNLSSGSKLPRLKL
jgi:hypothetical protein